MNLDNAYANSAHIPDGEGYFPRWAKAAAEFRSTQPTASLGIKYGSKPRQTYDFFAPTELAKGTVIFVHGGYWLASSPRDFSHLAAGAVHAGYCCALPSYTLAPVARISDITQEIRTAISAIAAKTNGPIYLVGHSAGGHLVARMACDDVYEKWQSRVARVMPISPLSDLAPLMQTSMNDTLRLDPIEAKQESPIQHHPRNIPVTVWVGGAERPAFLDQARWLVQAWGSQHVVDAGRHHFDVIEGLEDPTSSMMKALLG
ncbi:alpha/beta fold hydrolase [Octadecabacter sp.]|nr:alpha/beta fold hydrolase [Octadecabacter sp.]